MYTEFHIKASELNDEFLLKLKALLKGDERISITVEDEPDETEYLLRSEANRKMLEESLASKEGVELSDEEFNKLCKGGSIDFSKLKKVKLP